MSDSDNYSGHCLNLWKFIIFSYVSDRANNILGSNIQLWSYTNVLGTVKGTNGWTFLPNYPLRLHLLSKIKFVFRTVQITDNRPEYTVKIKNISCLIERSTYLSTHICSSIEIDQKRTSSSFSESRGYIVAKRPAVVVIYVFEEIKNFKR